MNSTSALCCFESVVLAQSFPAGEGICSDRSHSRRLSFFLDQHAPHPALSPRRGCQYLARLTALTRTMVPRGQSFDLRGPVAATRPLTPALSQGIGLYKRGSMC